MTPKLITRTGLIIVIALASLSLVGQISGAIVLTRYTDGIVNPAAIGLALFFELCAFLIITPIFYQFFKKTGIDFSKRSSVGLTFQGFSFAKLVTFGDYMVWRRRLRQRASPIGPALEYVILLYIFGIGALLGLFVVFQIVATLMFPLIDTENLLTQLARIPFVLTIFIIGIALISKTKWLRVRLQRFFKRYFGEAAQYPSSIIKLRSISKKQVAGWVGLMSVSWLLEATSYFFSMQAMGVDVPYLLAVYGYTFVRLFIMLPLFPGGIGEVEAASAVLFIGYGYDAATILAGSLLFRFITFWLPLSIATISLLILRQRSA